MKGVEWESAISWKGSLLFSTVSKETMDRWVRVNTTDTGEKLQLSRLIRRVLASGLETD